MLENYSGTIEVNCKDVDEILDKLLYMGYMDEQKSEIEDVIEMLPTILEAWGNEE